MDKEKMRVRLEKFRCSDLRLDLSRSSRNKSETSSPSSTKRTLRQVKKKNSSFKPNSIKSRNAFENDK